MYILTQDGKSLINGEFVSQFYIEENADKTVFCLMAATDDHVFLGSYPKLDHATTALKFIGAGMVDEDAQGKITAVPSQEDMALKDQLTSGVMPSPQSIEKLMAKLMGGGDSKPEGLDDFESFLSALFND